MERGRTETKELEISELWRRKKWKICGMAEKLLVCVCVRVCCKIDASIIQFA